MPYRALSQSPNVTFPAGTADVRGWEVRTTEDNKKVGTVKDLVFGGDNQPHFLEVETGRLFAAKRVLLPLGLARVDEQQDVIWVAGITKDQFKAWPEYTGDAQSITDDYTTRLRRAYSGAPEEDYAASARRFYEPRARTLTGEERAARVTRSEEELAIGKRAVQAGEVGVTKRVETERVRQSVPVTREEVTIERRPIEAGAVADAELKEDTIRVPLTEEEVVAEKRVVPKEEVVIRKESVQEDRVVEDTVRKERIDVDDQSKTTRGRRTRSRRKSGDEEEAR